jgi:hypothetical protein
MAASEARTFLEPDHYEASLSHAQIQAVILPRDKFGARPYLGGAAPFAGVAM